VTRPKVWLAGVAVLLIAGAAAFVLIDNNSVNIASLTQTERTSSEAPAPIARSGLADSSDKVRQKIVGDSKTLTADAGEIVLALDIEPGWHVNANPASMEFLIPMAAPGEPQGLCPLHGGCRSVVK